MDGGDVIILYQKGIFDTTIHDFEKFARKVFNGSNENEKEKLHKKLEQFTTFKEYYIKKHESEKFENMLEHSRKRQMRSPEYSSTKRKKVDSSKLFELPNEIWLKIMSYLKTSDLLKSFNRVCKHFNALSLDSSAIKFIPLKGIENRELYHQAVTILKRCKTLHEVYINRCSYLRDLIGHALKSSTRLRNLKIQGMDLSVKVFKNIKIWQGLQSLELIYVDMEDETLLEVAKIKTLKSLKMKNCKNKTYEMTKISKTCIKTLVENCQQFTELDLGHVNQIDLQEISQLKTLKSFKFPHNQGFLNAEQIKALGRCHELETIHLFFDYEDRKVPSELNDLFQKHKSSLKHVKIGASGRVQYVPDQNNVSFLDNLTLCENLETVSVCLTGFSNSDEEKIFQLQRLKKLSISGRYSLPLDLTRILVTEDLMTNLEELEVSSDVFRTSNSQIIFQLPKLKILRLNHSPWVLLCNRKQLIMNQMNCPLLERLFLQDFSTEYPFDINALSYLVKKYPALKILRVSGNISKNLTYEHLYRVCKESGIFIVISKYKNLDFKITDSPWVAPLDWLRFRSMRNGDKPAHQEGLESHFRKIDEQFYLKYLDMKRKHEEWCLQHDWPSLQ